MNKSSSTRAASPGGTRLKAGAPSDDGPLLFAIGASGDFGERICDRLHIRRSAHEERSFEDGEHKIRPLRNVRNRDVYVLHSLYGDSEQSPNDKLCRLFFLIGALKDAAGGRVTAVVPYLCYSRKDRQTKTRDPLTTRYISPDPGGVKRADIFREAMERALSRSVAGGFMEKHRSMGRVTGNVFAGDVAGRTVIVIDDLISIGGTMGRVAEACRDHGASRTFLAATHGLFSAQAASSLASAPFDKIAVTNTVAWQPSHTAAFDQRLAVIDVAGVFAEAIRRCHTGGSINELLGIEDLPQA